MNGTIKNLTINEYECSLYLPFDHSKSGKLYPVIYMNGGDEINISEIMSGIEPHFNSDCMEFLLLNVQSKNWNDDYSPWSAPALVKKSEPFGGSASKYLKFLTGVAKPFIDEHYQTIQEVENTALVGYSLGGLTALYALYSSGVFGKIGSLSGSLWFDNWMSFMNSNKPQNVSSKVYLSLGKGEENSRNQRMAKVGDCTREAEKILEGQLKYRENLILEWNDGGHFTEISQRIQRALLWLMKDERMQIPNI